MLQYTSPLAVTEDLKADIKAVPLTPRPDLKVQLVDKKSNTAIKNEKRGSQRLSSPLSMTQFSVSSISPPSTPSTPSTPQPFFSNTVRNHSFSSTNSLQSTISDQLLDHSHLKPGQNASLLDYSKTINMYRENAKKTNNQEIQCDFAIFLVEAAKRLGQKPEVVESQPLAYLMEAEKLLKQVAVRGHSESQYHLANIYASGLLKSTNFEKAFPLFVQSAKHHHPDAAYRAAKCYEEGLGTRKDKSKAVQYYKKAATLNHPGAMYRLGLAEMKGELNLSRNLRNGHKWLKRSAEAATPQYPHALHELAVLHEKGVESIIFLDLKYAVSLFHEAAMLGYPPSAYRLGECYEFGKIECPVDANLSIQYYSIAAQQNHSESCFALTAWYLVGVPDLLPASDEQAYAWALIAANNGLPRAEYAVGYFSEMGIGIEKDQESALVWYNKAAEHGEKRAIQRLDPTGNSNQKPPKAATKRLSFMSISSTKSKNSFMQRATSFLKRPSQTNIKI